MVEDAHGVRNQSSAKCAKILRSVSIVSLDLTSISLLIVRLTFGAKCLYGGRIAEVHRGVRCDCKQVEESP